MAPAVQAHEDHHLADVLPSSPASNDGSGSHDLRGVSRMSRRQLNWVDRLEPPEPEVARVLRRFLELDTERDAELESQYAHAVVQMVRATASEGEVANYLAYLQEQRGQAVTPPPMRRYVAIALNRKSV